MSRITRAFQAHRVRPVAAAMYDTICDGEWHDFETVIQQISPVVEETQAVRYCGRGRSENLAADVGRGRRDIARNAIHAGQLAGHVIRVGDRIQMNVASAAVWAAYRADQQAAS